jgi:3-oxoacyl-[acyl-carrier-protein] synthase-1
VSALATENAGLVVTCVESATPLAPNNALTAAAIRAGIAAFAAHESYLPLANETQDDPGELIVAMAGGAGEIGWTRLLELMSEPLAAVIAESGLTRADMARGGLYFALPYADAAIRACALQDTFLPAVASRLALPPVKEVTGTQTGSTGLYSLLSRAAEKIASGGLDFCVLAAADSYFIGERLEILDERWRLKTSRNPAGFIPGEAAAVLLVESYAHARARGAAPLIEIRSIGRRQEPNAAEGGKLSTGTALTGVIKDAHAAAAESAPLKWVLSDLDGERYKAFEWGITLSRLHEQLDPDHEHWHIAESVGSVGAASAGVQLGCVVRAFARGYAPAESALLFAGNDAGQRAAMLAARAA